MKLNILLRKYNDSPEHVKASLWYTICNILLKGIALLSTPIFTRILLEEQYGTYSIFQSWYNIIIIFTSLNLFLSSYNKGLILYKENQEEFTSSVLTLVITITIAFFILYIINIEFWSEFFELSPILMLGMFIQLITVPAIEFWSAKQRFDYKYKKFVIVSIIIVLSSLVLGVITVVISKYKVEAKAFSDVIPRAIVGIVFSILIIVKGRTGYDKEYWKYALKFNIPLIPHYLSTFILNQSDRIIIGKLVGDKEVAYYSIVYTISSMILLITTALNNSLVPYIYKMIDSKKEKNIRKNTTYLFWLVLILCILVMIVGPEVILIFAGKSYMNAIFLIPPIVASTFFIFIYSMFSTIEYYYQMTGFIAIASSISAVLNIVLNLIFIPIFGYYIAGYTTLISYICLAILHYISYRKILKKESLNEEDLYDLKQIILCSIILLLFTFIMSLIYKWIIIRYVFIFILLIIIYFKRKYVFSLLRHMN